MGKKSDVQLIVDGKRTDGRAPEDVRPISMRLDVVSRANGSAEVSFGKTTAVAAVYGPRTLFPRFMQESDTGIIRTRYNMAPFSVVDRKSPGPDRRSTEISKVVRLALEPSIFLEDFPKATIDVYVEIIQADGSTRVTGINAASLALVAAGAPMKDMVTAVSVGKIDDTLIVDLNGTEDQNSQSDVAVAIMPRTDRITLLQMDGVLTKDEVMTVLSFAKENCHKINEQQKKLLLEKYTGE
ncbi:exosome complex exonuclease Rrp41 [archaeon]|nr:MAG: exosome complex exonuclease Rrp41 [archaeon]